MPDYTNTVSLVGTTRRRQKKRSSGPTNGASKQPVLFPQDVFRSILTLERRRAERSSRPFVLMLVGLLPEAGRSRDALDRAVSLLLSTTRESDLIGWYRESHTLGIIFTEVTDDEKASIAEKLLQKIESVLIENLGIDMASELTLSVHIFPEDWDRDDPDWTGDFQLYPDLQSRGTTKRVHLAIKRALDIAGSAAILLLTFPLLALVAILIKLTSKGPILFKQERLGQFGARFNCLKFRTMYTNSDTKIHREYVQQFISGKAESAPDEKSQKSLYKITRDPRVTPIGRILRKISLDEFPQFFNVLRGDMSLVGPRPPLPYEFEVYEAWHRRRVLELKPGVTGLWQVSGRNRMRFEEMVRLDLRYSQKWSLWLDLKILLATPGAMLSGDCA